jgi:hypothetical protein
MIAQTLDSTGGRMPIRRVFFTIVALSLTSIATQAQTPAIPDTPVGKVVRAWYDAYGSGDTLQILDFYRTFHPGRVENGTVQFRLAAGGYDILSIERNEPGHMEFVARERKSPQMFYALVEIEPTQPIRIARSALLALPPTATLADLSIDAAGRAKVIEGASAQLDSFYVFPEVAKRVRDSLRARSARGAYDAFDRKGAFAGKMNLEVRELSHDKHMGFEFSARPFPSRPANPAPPTPDQIARAQAQADGLNCLFEKVENLAGNIAYLKFNAFLDPDVCGATASAAMGFVAGARALIVDMRENGGGSPAMVSYVSSYLFSQRTHLNDLWNRRTGQTTEFWTRDSLPGRKFGGEKPIYVLTSSNTFSGAEEFTYNLKSLKRATIVGETTGGGAHPVSGRQIDDHFIIAVPNSRAINPVTHTNWEGVGVEPDIKVAAADALDTALKLLRQGAPADERPRPQP